MLQWTKVVFLPWICVCVFINDDFFEQFQSFNSDVIQIFEFEQMQTFVCTGLNNKKFVFSFLFTLWIYLKR